MSEIADDLWDAASAVSLTESEACPTPRSSASNTMTARLGSGSGSSGGDHYPRQGKTLVIRSRGTGRMVVELAGGDVRAVPEGECGPGIFWRCEKTGGWFGFRNTVSGRVLGHTGGHREGRRGGFFWARVEHHREDEHFVTERAEGGGYVLLARRGGELWQMKVGEEGRLVVVEEGGTAWDFVEMESLAVSFAEGAA